METPQRTGGPAADPPPLTESDAALRVRLIDELTAAARQGHSPDVEALAGEHPRLADEFRSLWATIWITEWNGRRFPCPGTRPRANRGPEAAASWRGVKGPGCGAIPRRGDGRSGSRSSPCRAGVPGGRA